MANPIETVMGFHLGNAIQQTMEEIQRDNRRAPPSHTTPHPYAAPNFPPRLTLPPISTGSSCLTRDRMDNRRASPSHTTQHPYAAPNFNPGLTLPPISAPLLDPVDLVINGYKVKSCNNQSGHNKLTCFNSHDDEMPRRDPALFHYTSLPCFLMRNTGSCRYGYSCWYSHGSNEMKYHPYRYKTRLCKYGGDCQRIYCSFAHSNEELRSQ